MGIFDFIGRKDHNIPVLPPDIAVTDSIRSGHDEFYEVPDYVAKFISSLNEIVVPMGNKAKPQTICRLVNVFDSEGIILIGISYDYIEEGVPTVKDVVERIELEKKRG